MAQNGKLKRYGGLPYDGLFGDSNIVSVLEEVIADPYMEYHPIDLVGLTGETSPTVRKSLKVLTSVGLLLKDRTDRRHPVYRVNTKSKKYLALNLLAYAILDDKLGTDRVDRIIADYCDTVLREKYAQNETIAKTDSELISEYLKDFGAQGERIDPSLRVAPQAFELADEISYDNSSPIDAIAAA
jgi:DNA-binding transcriptional ArsR family regulator